MTLVDTSVWVDHLRAGNQTLVGLLEAGAVLVRPYIVGEIALGYLRQRALVLGSLQRLPHARVATDSEVLEFIERHALFGRGLGCVEAHLLAAVTLADDAGLWTRDKRLHAIAIELGLARA